MPVTRIEYESQDGRRSATVLYVSHRRWHVQGRTHHQWPVSARGKWAKTLTKAQAIARQWVGR